MIGYFPQARFSLLRGSGLKWDYLSYKAFMAEVLPLTREWIEINVRRLFAHLDLVLPLTREWIEILSLRSR